MTRRYKMEKIDEFVDLEKKTRIILPEDYDDLVKIQGLFAARIKEYGVFKYETSMTDQAYHERFAIYAKASGEILKRYGKGEFDMKKCVYMMTDEEVAIENGGISEDTKRMFEEGKKRPALNMPKLPRKKKRKGK